MSVLCAGITSALLALATLYK